MKVENTSLDGVLTVVPPTVFEDHRGNYIETYNQDLYEQAGIATKFLQDDVAMSRRHVLRGIHGDKNTIKLVSCLQGTIYLVVVNNNEESQQYRQWASFTISERNHLQVYVPASFGIGYLVMTESALFHYKQSSYYDRQSQFTLPWNDPELSIWWPVSDPILSRRDVA